MFSKKSTTSTGMMWLLTPILNTPVNRQTELSGKLISKHKCWLRHLGTTTPHSTNTKWMVWYFGKHKKETAITFPHRETWDFSYLTCLRVLQQDNLRR